MLLRGASFIAVFASLSVPVVGQTTHAPQTVPPAEAESHIVKRGRLVYPADAQVTRICGQVTVAITISSTGRVSSTEVVRGHPMLQKAAISAVADNQYNPFEENGAAVPVRTQVDVFFPCGNSQIVAEGEFFPRVNTCRKLLGTADYVAAERECGKAVKISDRLPQGRILDRSRARSLLASSIFLQRRPAESIPLYQEALRLDIEYLKSNDAELAADYGKLGEAYLAVGELSKADESFRAAVSTWEGAIQTWELMREKYLPRLKTTLLEYAKLKEAEAQIDVAQELRKKAETLLP